MKRLQLGVGLSLLLIGACSGGDGNKAADGGLVTDAAPAADAAIDAAPPVDCTGLASLPIVATNLTGFSGSEDFAFDADGNLVSNKDGNVTKQPKTGGGVLLTPNIDDTAGTRYLSNGDLVIAHVTNGELWRIKPDGGATTVVSGLLYPNGVEVDLEDFVYVAEHDAGRIRRINPDTGDNTVIATGLTNPNGLSFSPDYRTLYVNSFGAGTVHKIVVDDDGNWTAPEILGDIFDGDGGDDACEGDAAGNLCIVKNQAGVCIADGAGLTCSTAGNGPAVFEAACSGLGQGQPCSVTVGNSVFAGNCSSQFGSLTCEPNDDSESVCSSSSKGDACEAAEADFGAYSGVCINDFGIDLTCFPAEFGMGGQRGGLDGMAVDACGNIYVTEYTLGFIWRFTPEGVREKVATLPSFWIPNMHWGSGIGGWDENILYVMDRDEGRVFELDLGVKEKRRVYP